MADGAQFCWISRDGHLQSGDRASLLASLKSGELPLENPVTRAEWQGWFTAREVIENDGAPTTREPTFDLCRVSRRFDLDADSTIQKLPRLPNFEDVPDTFRDSGPPAFSDPTNPTLEIVTVPTGMPAFVIDSEPARPDFSRPTLQSPQLPEGLLPPPPPPVEPTPVTPSPFMALTPASAKAPSIAPTAMDVRTAGSGRIWPVLVGMGLALAGAAAAALIIGNAAAKLSAPTLRVSAVRSVSVPTVTAKPRVPTRCEAVGDETSIARIVPPGATIHVAGETKIAIGLPASTRTGIGVELDPKTLSETSREVFTDPVRVSGVMPTGSGHFVVDRYTVSVPAGFSLGMTPDGFSRIDADGSSRVIWPGEAANVITRPAVAALPGGGYLVAFRRGDGAGSVRVGVISAAGEKRSELGSLGDELVRAGAPSVAVNREHTAIVFSGMDADGARHLYMSVSRNGELPQAARPVAIPAQTPSTPSVAALEGDNFLLAWVERDSGQRQLLGAVIGPKLQPLAPPSVWTRLDMPVASTVLWSAGGDAAVLVTQVAASSRHELSALRLRCSAPDSKLSAL